MQRIVAQANMVTFRCHQSTLAPWTLNLGTQWWFPVLNLPALFLCQQYQLNSGSASSRVSMLNYYQSPCMFPSRCNTNTPPSFILSLSPDPSFVGDNILISQPRAANKCTVTDLPSWLEAWNVYVAIVVAPYPARAPALFAYQQIICNASSKCSPQAWLKYDSHFCSLAAADRSLRWDQKVNDLWLECFMLSPLSTSNPK